MDKLNILQPLKAVSVILLTSVCLFSVVGCAHQPTLADLARISRDKNLTAEERTAAYAALDPNPTVLYFDQVAPVFIIGILLLTAALIAKRRIDAKDLAAIDISMASLSGRSKAKSPAARSSDKSAKPSAYAGLPASYLEKIQSDNKAYKKLPENQAEAEAIPIDQRGASYFTGRPVPLADLQKVSVHVGHRQATIYATEQEAEKCQMGSIPRVRAFTIKGKTIPWYEWKRFDPYKHYWPMDDRGWVGTQDVIPTWLDALNCASSLLGYQSRKF